MCVVRFVRVELDFRRGGGVIGRVKFGVSSGELVGFILVFRTGCYYVVGWCEVCLGGVDWFMMVK